MIRKLFAVVAIAGLTGCSSQPDLKQIEGEYVRKADKSLSSVTVHWYIKEFNKKAGTVSITQNAVIVRRIDGVEQKPYEEKKQFTATYKPESDELFIEQRQVSYKVDVKKQTISAPDEVFTKVSDKTTP